MPEQQVATVLWCGNVRRFPLRERLAAAAAGFDRLTVPGLEADRDRDGRSRLAAGDQQTNLTTEKRGAR
jgi:hypothetical protein